ncbi:diguanylate cyclase [Desulfothermobacter acidiphilus]|uniref:GGDEF domain-containing protein n=1 Tax=Desulfothermobacter acidiphilus TaxID=1938353 RepID=UPI003F8BB952
MLEAKLLQNLASATEPALVAEATLAWIKSLTGIEKVRLITAQASASGTSLLPLSLAGVEVGCLEFASELDRQQAEDRLAPYQPLLALLLAFLSFQETVNICQREESALQETGKALTLFLAGQIKANEVLAILAGILGWEIAAFLYRRKSGEVVLTSSRPLPLSASECAALFQQPEQLLALCRLYGFAEGEVVLLDGEVGTSGYLILLRRALSPYPARRAWREALGRLGAAALLNVYLYQEVKDLAEHDELTGLYNRRKFWDVLVIELERAKRYQRHLALLLIDVDNFKDYNDTFGHLAGDECLRRIGEVIKKEIRVSDLAARYGGEEFVVLLVETGARGAITVAERLRRRVEAIGQSEPFPTLSLGVAVFPDDAREAEALLTCADNALYAAKRLGKNRTVWRGRTYSP